MDRRRSNYSLSHILKLGILLVSILFIVIGLLIPDFSNLLMLGSAIFILFLVSKIIAFILELGT